MKKFVNLVLSLIILAAVALSSTSCLFNFKKYYDYDWGSDSPNMRLNFTCSNEYYKTNVGTMVWEGIEYQFHIFPDYAPIFYASKFDLETYKYVSLFEATAKVKGTKLYLEITESSIQSLIGEVIVLTKTEIPDSFIGHRFRSDDSLFYVDVGGWQKSYLKFENVTYYIFPEYFDTGEYILFYDRSIVHDADQDPKDNGLLFIVTPKLEGDVLTLNVIRSNIENLLGQTFVLTKISE